MKNILTINNLSYKKILKNITFSITENTFNVLLGQNGSGKTMLLNCILGFEEYKGEVYIFNKQIDNSNRNDFMKEIGIVTSDNCLISGTVFDNLSFPLSNLGYNSKLINERCSDVSKELGITKILHKDIEDLSLSEKRVVSLAISIVHSPKLLFIDEDYKSIDEDYKTRIFKFLKKLKNCTILFFTNNCEDSLYASILLILYDGKLLNYGKPMDLFKDENLFVKKGFKLPFMVDLTSKLKLYKLLDEINLDENKVIGEIWK